jgi:hypothetical protein
MFTQVVPYRPEYGSGVRQKIFLDLYSPYDETLFIDSDCLVVGAISEFWTDFTGHYFGVPGFNYLKKGDSDPYMDVDRVLDNLQIEALPKFNGGVYYFTKSPEANRFFEKAREILNRASELGLYEFRGNGPNDESVYAIAMALYGIAPTLIRPRGMWTPIGYTGPFRLDAIRGQCSFRKDGMMLTPDIVHFPGEYGLLYPYARERSRLKLMVEGEKTPLSVLAKAFVVALWWQCKRHLRMTGKSFLRSVSGWTKARPIQAPTQ